MKAASSDEGVLAPLCQSEALAGRRPAQRELSPASQMLLPLVECVAQEITVYKYFTGSCIWRATQDDPLNNMHRVSLREV